MKQEVCATVTEFHRIRDTIFMVSASDADDPMTPNGKLQFSIVGGNDEGLIFSLILLIIISTIFIYVCVYICIPRHQIPNNIIYKLFYLF